MNNIIKFEVKNNLKVILICLIIEIALISMYTILYPSFAESIDEFTKLMMDLPDAMKLAFNVDPALFVQYDGFYVFTVSILSVVFGFVASIIAIKLFAIEKTKSISEYIYSKPISRKKLFVSKFLAGLFLIVLNVIIYSMLHIILVSLVLDSGSYNLDIILSVNLLMLTLSICIYALSIFISVFIKRAKVPAAYTFGIVMSLFVLNIIIEIIQKDVLKYISPFSIYDFNLAITKDADISLLVYCLVFTILLSIISCVKYNKEEV